MFTNVIEKYKRQPLLVICGIILVVQFIFIGYYNLTLGRESLDPDMAKLYVHAVEMWKNKAILVPGWSYITTLELDCSLLLAVPLFGLIGDIYTAYGIANIIFLLLFMWTIFKLFSKENVLYPVVALIFILIPYRHGSLDYMNMLFFNGSQYNIKVMLPLMLLGLLREDNNNKNTFQYWEKIIFSGIFFLLTLITAFSSGIYVVATGLFPVIAGLFLWKKFNNESIKMSYYIYSFITAIMTIFGMILNYIFEINSKGNSMVLCNVMGQLQENISSCLIGIFELFGAAAYSEIKVMSSEGIDILIRLFFVFAIFVCGYISFRKIKERQADELSAGLLAIFIWNTFVLLICDTKYGAATYEYRYHLMGMLPMLCLMAIVLVDVLKRLKGKEKYIATMLAVAVVLVLNYTSYKSLGPRLYPYMDMVCEYAREVNTSYVCFADGDSMNAEICRLLDYENEDTVYLTVKKNGALIVYDYYEKYIGREFVLENAIVLSDEQLEYVEVLGKIYQYCGEIGNKFVYQEM